MLDPMKILEDKMVDVVNDGPQCYLYNWNHPTSLSWLVVHHARQHLGSYGKDHRRLEGSAARALLFPNFPQRQIRLVKEQPKL